MSKLKSRKFWMTLAGAGLTVANNGLGLDIPPDGIMGICGLIATYVLGQGYADGQDAKAKAQGGQSGYSGLVVIMMLLVLSITILAGAAFASTGNQILDPCGKTSLQSPVFDQDVYVYHFTLGVDIPTAQERARLTGCLEAMRGWNNPATRAALLGAPAEYKASRSKALEACKGVIAPHASGGD